MTQPSARLSHDLLAAYAVGGTDPSLSLLIDAYAEMSGAARGGAENYEILAGALLEGEAAAPMAADAFERTMARLDAESGAAPAQSDDDEESIVLPLALRGAVEAAKRKRNWGFAGPGVRALKLDAGGAATVELLRIKPGCGAPRHAHSGVEYTLVLTGAFRDERGVYRAGDVSVATPETTHRPIAEPGEICYALAVSTGEPRFTGLLGWAQRIIPS